MKYILNEYSNIELKLRPELKKIIDSGLEVDGGCVLFTEFSKKDTNVAQKDFEDKTRYECFLNSFYVNDYIDSSLLEQSILFVEEIFLMWKNFQRSEILVAILSIDEDDFKLKFHIKRLNENYLNDDLDKYEEALLLVDSTTQMKSLRPAPESRKN